MNKRRILFLLIPLFVLIFTCGAGATLSLQQKTIHLIARDAQTGQPIPAAVIEAGGKVTAEPDITLPGASLGLIPRLPLRITAPGYRPVDASVFVPWWQQRQEAQINLEPTRLAGQVLDASDAPLQATLTAGSQVASTNAEGRFELLRLEAPVTLQVKAPGYKPWQAQLDATALAASPPLDIRLAAQNVWGTVTDAETGQPVAATVYLAAGQPLRADAQGHFELSRVEPPLDVRVEAPGYETWQTQVADLSVLAEGNPAYKLAVGLTPRVTSGQTRAADTNAPLSGLALTVASDGSAQTVTSDAEGRFTLRRLRPGDRIAVTPPPSEGYLPVEVEFNNEAELSISLPPRQVVVTVHDNFSHQPADRVQVSLTPNLTALTNAQGQVTLSRVPENGSILVTQTGYQTVTLAYTGQPAVEVSLTPSAFQGIVRASDTGQPLPQATLYVNNKPVRADDNGHFVLDLPPSPGQLMVKSAGYNRAYGQLSPTGVITGYTPPFAGDEGRWLAVAPCAEPQAQPGPPCLDFTLEPFQAKAIYVPFHYLGSRDTMLRYLDFIQATGELNAIVVDVKGDFGQIGWKTQVITATTVGADTWHKDTWMPLDELVAEAHRRNIYAVARMVVFKDDPLAHGLPELAAAREDGSIWLDGEDLGWANPFRPEVWDYNIALAREVAAFGFDELNFDYIRFPSDGDVGAIVYEEENTLETRTAAIREFMRRLTDALRPTGAFVSADVFGLTIWVKPESDMHIGQRVMDLAPFVDYLAPMVYPSTFIPGNLGYSNPSAEPYGVVYRSQLQAVERVPAYVKVRPWLQGYWYSLDEMRELKRAAIDAQSTGWSWWNAGGKYDSELFGEEEK